MQRRTISCLVLGLAVAILLVFVPHVLLIVFAGLLTAVLLHGAGALLAGALRLPVPAGIGLFVLLLAAALAGFGYFAAGRIAGQFQDLANQLPGAIEALRGRIESYSWGPTLLQWAHDATIDLDLYAGQLLDLFGPGICEPSPEAERASA